MNLSDYGRSVIRTVVPLLVGAIVGFFATKGIDVDRTALTSVLDAVIGGAYYLVIRAIEKKHPSAGYLLGAKGAPSYEVKPAVMPNSVAPMVIDDGTGKIAD